MAISGFNQAAIERYISECFEYDECDTAPVDSVDVDRVGFGDGAPLGWCPPTADVAFVSAGDAIDLLMEA